MNLIFFFSAHSSNIPFMDSKKKNCNNPQRQPPSSGPSPPSYLSLVDGKGGGVGRLVEGAFVLGSLMFGFISPERQIKQFVAVCLLYFFRHPSVVYTH